MNNENEDNVFDMEPLQATDLVVYDAPTENAESYDIEAARQNMHHLIQKGNHALDEMLNFAKQSQNARAFEVVANLLKTMADINKDLVSIQEKKKQLRVEDDKPPEVINNNLFVGTTEDFQKMLTDIKNGTAK